MQASKGKLVGYICVIATYATCARHSTKCRSSRAVAIRGSATRLPLPPPSPLQVSSLTRPDTRAAFPSGGVQIATTTTTTSTTIARLTCGLCQCEYERVAHAGERQAAAARLDNIDPSSEASLFVRPAPADGRPQRASMEYRARSTLGGEAAAAAAVAFHRLACAAVAAFAPDCRRP